MASADDAGRAVGQKLLYEALRCPQKSNSSEIGGTQFIQAIETAQPSWGQRSSCRLLSLIIGTDRLRAAFEQGISSGVAIENKNYWSSSMIHPI